MQKLVCMILALVLYSQCDTKQLNRCQIVHELRNHGFPENKLRDWVCLVEHESSGRTDVISPFNSDGSRDYGFFQINDRYWCSNNNQPGKACNATCAELTTDNITKAAKCAKKIFARQGFKAWYGWKNNCQGSLPDISNC